MGLRGPQAKPNHLKLITGTLKGEVSEPGPPIPADQALTELPPPPFPLPNDIAVTEWNNVGTSLVSRGLLSADRLMALATYCAMSGKIAQKFQAGDVPPAHLIQQQRAYAKELGLIGQSPPREATDKPAAKGRLARLKDRANRVD